MCGVEQLKLQLVALRAAGAYCRGCRPCAAAVGEPLAEACTVPPLAAHQHCTAPPLLPLPPAPALLCAPLYFFTAVC